MNRAFDAGMKFRERNKRKNIVLNIIQMIKDNIAIQRGGKNRNKQTSPNNFWWMPRGERRRRTRAWYKELGIL